MGQAYQSETGHYTESLPVNRLALHLAEEAAIVDPLTLWACHINMSEHGLMTADPPLALLHANKTVEVLEQHPDLGRRSQDFGIIYLTYVQLAEAFMAHHQWDKAIDTCDYAISESSHDGTPGCPGWVVTDKAHCLWRKGCQDEAWETLDSFWSTREKYYGPTSVLK